MFKHLEKALEDVLFIRIIYISCSIPFIILLIFRVDDYTCLFEKSILYIIPIILIILLILHLLYIGVFADEKKIRKCPKYIDALGEPIVLLLFLVVVILAVPIWKGLRLIWRIK